MSHKGLIGSTNYGISGGSVLINGTGYSISEGKTLINGTVQNVPFSKELVIYDGGDNLLVGTIEYRMSFFSVVQTQPEGVMSPTSGKCEIINGEIRLVNLVVPGTYYGNTIYGAYTYIALIKGIDLYRYSTLHLIGYKTNMLAEFGVTSTLLNGGTSPHLYTVPEIGSSISSNSPTEISLDISEFSATEGYIVLRPGMGGTTSSSMCVSKIWLT